MNFEVPKQKHSFVGPPSGDNNTAMHTEQESPNTVSP